MVSRLKNPAIALALLFLFVLALSNYADKPSQELSEFGEINFVYDGDTFRVKTDAGELKTVRIIGADSPEIQSQYRNQQCFGEEASKFAHEQFFAKRVELIKDPFTSDKDKYDRYLRYLKLETGEYISEILIKNGYAKVYQGADFENKGIFTALEQQAKQSKLGLWAACSS
ncbi:MAG: thermonuclease family protein [bacterium]|nr:thermonuclease family protein [bacterium]